MIPALLTQADIELHERLGIPAALLEAAQVRRVTDADARRLLGVRHRGDLACARHAIVITCSTPS